VTTKQLKTSGFYYGALAFVALESVLEIADLGNTSCHTYTVGRIISGVGLMAFFGWLCFRAGQESRS